MKRMLMPLLLLVFVTLFCSVCILRTDQICNETADLIEQAGDRFQQGSYEEAEEFIRRSELCWDSHEGFLGMVLRHTESDDVGFMFPSLLASCQAENRDAFLEKELELEAYLRQLSRMEIPYYFNVL